jgi:hypothetical protein
MRTLSVLALVFCAVSCPCVAQQAASMSPKDVQLSGYHQKELPASLLARIKATTDTFEVVDGIAYEDAVDLYKRDVNPEENLVLWEEMARAYKIFCKSRCTSTDERMDVYRSLLLRTMYTESEALRKSRLKVLQPSEAAAAMQLYRLPPKPIAVVQTR